MKVITIPVGYLSTNCYLLIKGNNALVVDPGDEPDKIIEAINENKVNVKGILITHHHSDHTGALKDIKQYCKCDVYSKVNLKEGPNSIDDFDFEIIYTPGHTKDGITIYFKSEKLMLTGDFLFKDTIGRYDLEDSSLSDMIESIGKIKQYDNDITIYPGHGEDSNLGYEKENNEYLKMY